MKTSVRTIRLDREPGEQLDTLTRRTGRTRSQIVREALRRRLAAAQLDDLRRRVMPFAGAAGCLTDEDAFQNTS